MDISLLNDRRHGLFRRSAGLQELGEARVLAQIRDHHVGPPGAGKSMLAARLPGIMPPLSPAEALETSELVGRPLKEVKLPPGVLLGAIVRDGEMICPRGSTVVQTKDRVVLFAAEDVIHQVEKMFSVQLEYF